VSVAVIVAVIGENQKPLSGSQPHLILKLAVVGGAPCRVRPHRTSFCGPKPKY